MQCDNLNVQLSHRPPEEIGAALDELSKLPAYETAKSQYLREVKRRNSLNMLTINTRYVSNVSIGFRVRPLAPHVRYKPYSLPSREPRQRTRSETECDLPTTSLVKAIIEDTVNTCDDLMQLKKAKSLESILNEDRNFDIKAIKFPEVEVVSDRIQKLRVE